MAHFEDLSDYVYDCQPKVGCHVQNVGWLESAHVFPTEPPSEDFLERLWIFCGIVVNPTRGLHLCGLCSEPISTFVRNGTRVLLGSGEIRVFSPEGEVFAAPNLVYHYVQDHHYRPPPVFVLAVLTGASPPTESYARMLEENGLIWRENHPVQEEPKRFRFVRTEAGVIEEEVTTKSG